MAKYMPYSYSQGQFIPEFFNKQIQKGTFEYTLSYLADNELKLSILDQRFRNDHTGAPAYDPRFLLKVILFVYSRGITSRRAIAQCCEENVLFMALSTNSRPHFTTIADFISSMDNEVIHLFLQVLLVCYQQNLIGKEMFAIDGCKLPSNASKEWSGTRADLKRKAEKMKRRIDTAVGRTLYGMRLAVGEPPFAHIRSTIGLDRYSLRGKKKVNVQWNLFCLVHNLKRVHTFDNGFI